ncbi:hypothetical protein [Moorena producens]|uniref:hypothetical protein n=1 Tax=Moorena producens TaxID=1155739 RepID=UPI0011EA6157|nr:hypothetical protein [Moorena producens]
MAPGLNNLRLRPGEGLGMSSWSSILECDRISAEAEAVGHATRTLHRVAAQWARIPCSRFLYDGAIGET